MEIKIRRENKSVELPSYKTSGSAGMDLRSSSEEQIVIIPGETRLVPTGLRIALPLGYEAQIRPRSGLALKHGITLVNTPGTVDADYRGEIGIIMINHGKENFIINKGERIAQMVINKVETPNFIEVEELGGTERGEGGFGSTGVK